MCQNSLNLGQTCVARKRRRRQFCEERSVSEQCEKCARLAGIGATVSVKEAAVAPLSDPAAQMAPPCGDGVHDGLVRHAQVVSHARHPASATLRLLKLLLQTLARELQTHRTGRGAAARD